MAVAWAEIERVKRGTPDFERLGERIRAGAARKGKSLRELSLELGFSHATIPEMLRHRSKAGRDLLIAIADYFDESREEWQEMGGFDVENLPQDRGWTTAERTLARWLGGLSKEDREALLSELPRNSAGSILRTCDRWAPPRSAGTARPGCRPGARTGARVVRLGHPYLAPISPPRRAVSRVA